MDEIPFSDWPGEIASAGNNPWLPAYGFQTPTALLEKEDFINNPDSEYFFQSNVSHYVYLETIQEETSDDLHSESDVSELKSPIGWLGTESESGSAIYNDSDACESDREIACPSKRRRQDPNLLTVTQDEDIRSLSRSSSLLQFESLERQCQEACTCSTPTSIGSHLSYDPYDAKNVTSSITTTKSDSDDSTLEASSSHSLDNLKSWHSLDSLPLQTSYGCTKPAIMSAENLSEDSGYSDTSKTSEPKRIIINNMQGDHNVGFEPVQIRTNGTTTDGVVVARPRSLKTNFDAYDYCEAYRKFYGNFSVSYQNLCMLFDDVPKSDNRYEAVNDGSGGTKSDLDASECSVGRAKYKYASEPNLHDAADAEGRDTTTRSVPKDLDVYGDRRPLTLPCSIASKNLDLVHLVGDPTMTARYREGSYAEAMTHRVDLSDDEHSLRYRKRLPRSPIVDFDRKSLECITESLKSLERSAAYISSAYIELSKSVRSTPDLNRAGIRQIEEIAAGARRRSTEDIVGGEPSTTSGMSDVDDTVLKRKGSVHFSPVVSEVNDKSKEDEEEEEEETVSERESSSTSDSVEIRPRLPNYRPVRYAHSQPELAQHSDDEDDEDDEHEEFVRSLKSLQHSKSQPDVSRLRRRGSQLIKRDGDGCVIKAYVDGDGIQYKHTHLDLDAGGRPDIPTRSPTTIGNRNANETMWTGVSGDSGGRRIGREPMHVDNDGRSRTTTVMNEVGGDKRRAKSRTGKLGGFLSRLASFRFSKGKANPHADAKTKKLPDDAAKYRNDVSQLLAQNQRVATKADYIYIPLKAPPTSRQPPPPAPPSTIHTDATPPTGAVGKPPLPKAPPRIVGASVKRDAAYAQATTVGDDDDEDDVRRPEESRSHRQSQQHRLQQPQPQQRRRRRTLDSGDRPMEPMGLIETDLDTEVTIITNSTNNVKTRSLLDLGHTAPQRRGHLTVDNVDSVAGNADVAGNGRPHKSMEFLLDKQNIRAVEPPENELQKGERVMSEHQLRVQRSLQKLTVPDWYKQSQIPREGFLLKKSNERESRWTGTVGSKTISLSSLGSGGTHQSPLALSPTAFNHSTNQSFVRWSTSKLNAISSASSPCASVRSSFSARQPNGSISPSSVRSSFSYRQPYLGWRSQERLAKPRTPAERLANSLLDGQTPSRPIEKEESSEIQTSIKEVTSAIVHYVSGLRPDGRDSDTATSSSPRGSQKLCWLESSFVGTRPLDSPQTPVTLSVSQTSTPVPPPLRLDLQGHDDLPMLHTGPRPSPGSTTLEDVLDSLLGLPPTDRATSPSLQVTGSANNSPQQEEPNPIRCRYSRCGRPAALETLKRCHNCAYTYCSKACRRAHWEKHRRTCLLSRIGALCRRVIAAAKEQPDTLLHLSRVARRGHLAHGHGAVKCFFATPEAAERFLIAGIAHLGELTYVPWSDLQPSEMGPQLYAELVRMCKSYDAEAKLVLYVSVCVVSEAPTAGACRWQRQLVSRCAKMRLSRQAPPDPDNLETFVLYSRRETASRAAAVTGVEAFFQARGVDLSTKHGSVARQLAVYAEEDATSSFAPITVCANGTDGRSFMCILMLEADDDALDQIERTAGVCVRSIDVCGSTETILR